MQPAACSIGSKGDPMPHWRAEMCFSRCACPREKQILIYFPALRRENSSEGFLTMQYHLAFRIDMRYFDEISDGREKKAGI